MLNVKSLILVFLLISGVSLGARAESPTASNVFALLKGTTTIDKGGAIESQARSIYSLGGGMSSFHAKRVSLIAADPPSFSAGCNGISWHFGGFAFISMDEIRQMVEAVAQASLGVAVDLAMQTLCPQCYAIMSKLRDVANAMRNAAADSCKMAENMGALLKSQFPGVFNPGSAASQCGTSSSGENLEGSSLASQLTGGVCAGLDSVMTFMNTKGQDVINYLNGAATSNGKTPDKATLDQYGNTTYAALTALGYKDGFVKNVLLSYLGMRIIYPKADATCAAAFKDFKGTSKANSPETGIVTADTSTIPSILQSTAGVRKFEKKAAGDSEEPQIAFADVKTSKPDATGTTKVTGTVCDAPAQIPSTEKLANLIMCGSDPVGDRDRLKNKYPLAKVHGSAFEAMCGKATTTEKGTVRDWSAEAKNTMIYQCGPDSAECMQPKMVRLQDAIDQDGSGANAEYTGLGWMVLDSLYAGVQAIMENQPLPANTVAILNGSGYPLYRLLNLAAVYPGMTDELLSAYSASIAVQYATTTLSKLMMPGSNPAISYLPSNGVPKEELIQFRSDIMNMTRQNDKISDDVLKRLNEKRALVDAIVQVNKALQAEVISQGLGGNADLAISLKKQVNNQ